MDPRTPTDMAAIERLLGIGTWVWYPPRGPLHCSDGLGDLLGLASTAEPTLATLQGCFHPQDRASFAAGLEETLATGADLAGDYRIPFGDTVRWLQCRARLEPAAGDRDRRLVGVLRDITSERALLHELSEAAIHDPLTGLLNRFAIGDRLEHALDRLRRHDRQVAVMFVDLDGLKAINDRLGHRWGDDVLRAVGRRLVDAVRHEDSVGRYGGDEFVVVCEDLVTPRDALLIAERIVERVRLRPSENDPTLEVTSSVGVTAAKNGDAAADVLARADEAMYEAKRGGGARVVFRH